MESNVVDVLFTPAAASFPDVTSVNHPVSTAVCLIASDVLALVIAMLLASAVRDMMVASVAASVTAQILAALLLALCSLTATGMYPGVGINPVEELRRATLALTLAFSGLWSATFFLHDLTQSRLIYAIGYVLAIFFVPFLRAIVRRVFSSQPWWGSAVAILGYGTTGKFVLNTLSRNPGMGLRPVAILDDDPGKYLDAAEHLQRGPLSRCAELAGGQPIPYGIVCMPSLSRTDLLILVERYSHWFAHLIVIPNLIGMTSLGVTAREVGGIVGLEMRKQLLRPSARLTKRAFDLLFTILIAPVIATIVGIFAIIVKLEDRGPIFYASERVGLNGKIIKVWKLRSMLLAGEQVLESYLNTHPKEAEVWHATQKLKHDPRITRVGRLIRKTSIDELPQFWNVFIGEMSVVGPRPIMKRQIELYGDGYAFYKQMRPGITGLWQISGRNKLTFTERSRLDQYVIQNWSVWLDLYILSRTPRAVFTANGAC